MVLFDVFSSPEFFTGKLLSAKTMLKKNENKDSAVFYGLEKGRGDRNHNLLIGNRAHYSANLHLELLSREIWEQN